MSIISRSIVVKFWLTMVLIVMIILFFSGLVQTRELKKLYYNQQMEQLIKEGEHISINFAGNRLYPLTGILKTMADMLSANIMIVDSEGYIKECQGMGINMSGGGGERINVAGHHGMPWKEQDLESVKQGRTITYRGPNSFFDKDIISVAVPVYEGQQVTGAVMLSAPLAPIEGRILDLQKITLYTGIAGIILATILSLFFSRTLSRPLLNMNMIARAMAGGDYSRQVEVKSKDEIGILAESLNSLSLRLQDKVAALERLDQTRREFVANVSHELRPPLSIMLGYTEALIDGLAHSDTDRQKYLNNIHEEILRLRRLVTELLDLSRMEAGQVNAEMHETDVAAVAGRVFDKFQAVAAKKGVELRNSLPSVLHPVLANPDRLEQVFINLLDNAIRVTPAGGVVEMTAYELKNELRVSISDEGHGIPPEEQPLVWERFYKVDKSRTRTGEGTGLGLAIVKKIVEAHGGSVEIASMPEKGSTFSFTIPKKL
ncbi:MAG: HAMP domain-containing protein [Pelotomaculum sp.]|nr:HAMP domain-containing protein [Pelotomaculum sp.]